MRKRNASTNPSNRRTKADTARENGCKSHGAVTPEGQLRAATASITHGLTAKAVVLTNECPRKYAALRQSFFAEWQPVGPTEESLVNQMVNAHWRLCRIWTMETCLIDSAMFFKREEFEYCYSTYSAGMRAADAVCALNLGNKVNLETLHRYELTYSRSFERAMFTLRKIRGARGEHHTPGQPQRPGFALLSSPPPAVASPQLQPPPALDLPVPKLPIPYAARILLWLRWFATLLISLRNLCKPARPQLTTAPSDAAPEAASGTHARSQPDPQPQSPNCHPESASFHPAPAPWQPAEPQYPMDRAEFLLEGSGTFTYPEYFHFEPVFTPHPNMLIPNGCLGCPACKEREEATRPAQPDSPRIRKER